MLHRDRSICLRRRLVVVVLCLPVASSLSCRPESPVPQQKPEETIVWRGKGGGFRRWGSTGDRMYGVSVSPKLLDIWQWDGKTMKKKHETKLPDTNVSVALLPDERFAHHYFKVSLTESGPRDIESFCLGSAETGEITHRWNPDAGRDWGYRLWNSSFGMRYVAVWARPSFNSPDHDWKHPIVRIGILSHPRFDKVDWLVTLQSRLPMPLLDAAVPSADGAYIALGGWHYGVALIDVAKKRLVW